MTGCECQMAGYCTRHRVHKNQAAVDLCKNNRDFFLQNEVRAGNITEPGIIEKGKNLTVAVVKHALDGFNEASLEEQQRRIEICNNCPLMNKFYETCRVCGCPIKSKIKLSSSSCPDNPPRW